MATVIPASKSASPKIRACYIEGATPCDETTVITEIIENGSVFPTYFLRDANVITVNADSNT
jgi:hypothetical protein